jgi:hypothetical protein
MAGYILVNMRNFVLCLCSICKWHDIEVLFLSLSLCGIHVQYSDDYYWLCIHWLWPCKDVLECVIDHIFK